ncbi:helix-turn-helix domain-containing protein [Fundidesulfovibrio terrae]|uniref:helix-turn-helix domain-containing protein n=1 Tax=Fundidesulfovibrio terrae TaxID=2922866 RepID=UPI001FAF3DFE|nr:helix-turn-helix domain-containing protein [Fundidesulfovibrio terrae]
MSDKYPRIKAVEACGETRLKVDFGRDGVREVDLSEFATGKKAVLRDEAAFAAVRVGEYGASVEWPGIGLEVGGDALWRMSERQFGNAMRPEDFKAWRKRLGLTQAATAKELGITRRAVIYYEQGARIIPKVVMLACKALEMERERQRAA